MIKITPSKCSKSFISSDRPNIKNIQNTPTKKRQKLKQIRPNAVSIDWTDPGTLSAIAGAAIGLAIGIGVPVFLVSRDDRDDERLEEIRQLNKSTFDTTGEYLSKVLILNFVIFRKFKI